MRIKINPYVRGDMLRPVFDIELDGQFCGWVRARRCHSQALLRAQLAAGEEWSGKYHILEDYSISAEAETVMSQPGVKEAVEAEWEAASGLGFPRRHRLYTD